MASDQEVRIEANNQLRTTSEPLITSLNLSERASQAQIIVNNGVSSSTTRDFPTLSESYGAKFEGDKVQGVADAGVLKQTSSGGPTSSTEKEGLSVNPNLENNPKQWRELFPKPREVESITPMNFTPPVEIEGKIQVVAKSDNFAEGLKRCKDLVIGCFVGKRLSFAAVQAAAGKIWKFRNEVTIKLYGDSVFVFEFLDDEDRNLVLATGSVFISNKLFTLRPWSTLLEKNIAEVKKVPIWVLIYGVPLHLWNNEGLGLIASFLGKPLFADNCTLNQTRLAYARVCVEIGVDFTYPASIPLLLDGKTQLELSVEYHWKASLCETCKVFGHSENNGVKQKKAKWVPKKVCKPVVVVNGAEEEGVPLASDILDVGSNSLDTPILVVSQKGSLVDASVSSNKEAGPGGSLQAPKEIVVLDVRRGAGIGLKDSSKGSPNTKSSIKDSSPKVVGTTGKGDKVIDKGHKGAGMQVGGSAGAAGRLIPSSRFDKGGSSSGAGAKEPDKSPGMHSGNLSAGNLLSGKENIDSEIEGDWKVVKGRKQSREPHQHSPKKNPFMVYSDFKSESRFPINRKKEDEEFENIHKHLSEEEKKVKKQEREMRRLQWSGNSDMNGSESAGKGVRAQQRKNSLLHQ